MCIPSTVRRRQSREQDEEESEEGAIIQRSVLSGADTASEKKSWTSRDLKALDQEIEDLLAESRAFQKARREYFSTVDQDTTSSTTHQATQINPETTIPSADIEIKIIKLSADHPEASKVIMESESSTHESSMEKIEYPITVEDLPVYSNMVTSFTFISKSNRILIRNCLYATINKEVKRVTKKKDVDKSNMLPCMPNQSFNRNSVEPEDIKFNDHKPHDDVTFTRCSDNDIKLLSDNSLEGSTAELSLLSYMIVKLDCRRDLQSCGLYSAIANWASVLF